MYQDKRKVQADKMNYFDCHVDTLTEILKPGDTLDENSCNVIALISRHFCAP